MTANPTPGKTQAAESNEHRIDAATRRRLLRLCRKVNGVDDALGSRSDHEGDESGPTYSLFLTCDRGHYADIVAAQVEEHLRGARLWRSLGKLHAKRK